MNQQGLREFPSHHFQGTRLEKREDGFHVGEVFLFHARGQRRVGVQRRGIDRGEHPVGIIQRDGRDAVTVRGQEFLEAAPRGRVLSGVEIGMAEVDRAAAQRLRDCRFAAQQVGLIVLERGLVQVGVRPGMVAQRGPVVQPYLEDGLQPRFAESFGAAGIDEANQRDAAQGREQLHGHGADGSEIAVVRRIAAARQVVDGDGDLSRLSERGQGADRKSAVGAPSDCGIKG